MNPSASHFPPGWTRVSLEQLRAIGVAVRGELVVLGLILCVVTVVVLINRVATGTAFDFSIEAALPVVAVGLFAPMAIWRGEEPARRSYLWTLPVERAPHTLIRVGAGWLWLLGTIGGYLAWGLALAWLTGGEVGVEQMRLLTTDMPEGFQPAAGDYYTHRRPTPGWQWLVPFTGATITYLLGSIVVLASDHPWRWFATLFFSVLLLMVLADGAELRWLGQALVSIQEGRFGLEVLLTGSIDESMTITLADGREGRVLVDRPLLRAWAAATLLWGGLGLAGTWLAAHQFQER